MPKYVDKKVYSTKQGKNSINVTESVETTKQDKHTEYEETKSLQWKGNFDLTTDQGFRVIGTYVAKEDLIYGSTNWVIKAKSITKNGKKVSKDTKEEIGEDLVYWVLETIIALRFDHVSPIDNVTWTGF